jgi:succinoglycan biosynthesis protein ExoO
MSRSLPHPLVSVIMANRDGALFVAEAVASVLAQTLRSIELILADDASRDDSIARVLKAAGADSRLKVIRLPRSLGAGGARNRALAQARGQWIAVVDSDDLIAPDRLEHLLAFAESHAADLVADNLLPFGPAGEQPPWLRGRKWARPREVGLAEFADSNRVYGRVASLGYLKPMIRRAALERLDRVWDETLRIGEDFDLVARLLAIGARYWIDPVARYRYRRHPGSTSHRLRRSDIEALLDADRRFCVRGLFEPQALAALERRRRSLWRALAYDGLILAIKAKAPWRAVRQAFADPTAIPLLMAPVAARLAKLRGAT